MAGSASEPSSQALWATPVLALAFEIRRPSVDREIRNMIRQMNAANPLWGAPRIHGELLERYIEISSR